MDCPVCNAGNAAGARACLACGAPLEAATAAATGALFAGRYEILAPIGRGGMGMVYRARDRHLDEVVALKLIRPDLAQERRLAERFRSEIKLARRIRHPNVCSIFGDGEERGILYLCMELVEGQDLRRLVREHGPLSQAEAFEVAIQAAAGLHAIHAAGIVHRDLKAANIMRDARGVVRLMDFGLARHAASGPGVTATGSVVGTPEYMSPEQARGQAVGPGGDIYSLGVVTFELFTGDVPFHGDTSLATLMKHIEEVPPLSGPRAARLPLSLVPVLRRALAKDPNERHASAEALAEDLRRARDLWSGETAETATRASPGSGSARPTRRRPGVGAAAGLGIALVAGLGILLVVLRPDRGAGPSGVETAATALQSPPGAAQAPSRAASPRIASAGEIRHEPVGCMVAGQFPLLDAALNVANPRRARVFFRSNVSPEEYYFVGMERSGDLWTGKLPKPNLAAGSIGYYIACEERGSQVRTEEHSVKVVSKGADCAPGARVAAFGPSGAVSVFAEIPGTDLAFPLRDAFGIEELLGLLRDPDPGVRERAATSLGSVGAALSPAVENRVGALSSGESEARVDAADDLGKTGRRVIRQVTSALVERLLDQAPDVRRAAGEALGQIGPVLALSVSALREASKDNDPSVRRAAAEAFGSMGGVLATAASALEEASDKERDPRAEDAIDTARDRIREATGGNLQARGKR